MFSFVYQQCQEGQEILPDQIKAVLFDTAGYAGMIWSDPDFESIKHLLKQS